MGSFIPAHSHPFSQAAVVLGIEILTFPDGSEADALRAIVRATAFQLEKHMVESVSRPILSTNSSCDKY